jgi:hypothetical protein
VADDRKVGSLLATALGSEAGLRGRVQARPECRGQPAKKRHAVGGRVRSRGTTLLVLQTPPPQETGRALAVSGPVSHWILTKQARQELSAAPQRHGSASILNNNEPLYSLRRRKHAALNLSNTLEVLSSTTHKVASTNKRIWRFVLPNSVSNEPRLDASLAGQ